MALMMIVRTKIIDKAANIHSTYIQPPEYSANVLHSSNQHPSMHPTSIHTVRLIYSTYIHRYSFIYTDNIRASIQHIHPDIRHLLNIHVYTINTHMHIHTHRLSNSLSSLTRAHSLTHSGDAHKHKKAETNAQKHYKRTYTKTQFMHFAQPPN